MKMSLVAASTNDIYICQGDLIRQSTLQLVVLAFSNGIKINEECTTSPFRMPRQRQNDCHVLCDTE